MGCEFRREPWREKAERFRAWAHGVKRTRLGLRDEPWDGRSNIQSTGSRGELWQASGGSGWWTRMHLSEAPGLDKELRRELWKVPQGPGCRERIWG